MKRVISRRIIPIICLCGAFFNSTLGQKCVYDSAGPQEVPFTHATNTALPVVLRTIKGKVTHATGSSLAGARLALFRIEDGECKFVGSIQTGEDGEFCFGRFPDGKYELHVGTVGYQKIIFPVKVRSHGRNTLKVLLEAGN